MRRISQTAARDEEQAYPRSAGLSVTANRLLARGTAWHASKLQPNAKILAISGGGKYLDADQSLNVMDMLGVNATLLKPFGRDDLIAAVNDLLGQ